jgi:serine/threonine protein kinase
LLSLPAAKGEALEGLSETERPNVPGYELLEELGHGGMGVVWKVWQVKAKRVVALKMLLPTVTDRPTYLARAQSEAEALARLRHPNIVQVYEVGEHKGLPFFAQQFVDGGTLARRIAQTLPPPPEAARLVETLARAMQSAHQVNVIHRDLKPANVLLHADKETRRQGDRETRRQGEQGELAHVSLSPCPLV